MSICLNMIVKNEEPIIANTLANILDHIQIDHWVICDTGSTDQTMKAIQDFFDSKGIKGKLCQHEWVDFGTNRTLALQEAYGLSDYLLIFDADDSIHGSLILPPLIHDAYRFKFGTSFVYYRPLLINNRKRWKFVGVLHEYLQCLEPSVETSIEGDYHVVSGRFGARSQDPNKYLKDALILSKAFETEPALRPRYAFYCAQSYKDSGRPKEAIEWYKKSLELNGYIQERYYACLMIGYLLSDPFEKIKFWTQTIIYDKERIEGVAEAMRFLREHGAHAMVVALYHQYKGYNKHPRNKLFLFSHLYNDVIEYNYSISAFYVGENAKSVCEQILENGLASKQELEITKSNLRFY
jgi:glycosyltransferase involved in cell wall biosynthesis